MRHDFFHNTMIPKAPFGIFYFQAAPEQDGAVNWYFYYYGGGC